MSWKIHKDRLKRKVKKEARLHTELNKVRAEISTLETKLRRSCPHSTTISKGRTELCEECGHSEPVL